MNLQLFQALKYKDFEVIEVIEAIKLALENGEKINDDHNAALRYAIQNNVRTRQQQIAYLKIFRFLLKKGSDIHVWDSWIFRVLAYHGEQETTITIKFFWKKGANIHARNDEPVRLAAWYNYCKHMKFLLSKGANIHALNDDIFERLFYTKSTKLTKRKLIAKRKLII